MFEFSTHVLMVPRKLFSDL